MSDDRRLGSQPGAALAVRQLRPEAVTQHQIGLTSVRRGKLSRQVAITGGLTAWIGAWHATRVDRLDLPR